jgi:hypothetical protein
MNEFLMRAVVDMFNIGLASVSEIIAQLVYSRVCAESVPTCLYPK